MIVRNPWIKAACVAAGLVLVFFVVPAVALRQVPEYVRLSVNALLLVALVVLGCRIFRGRNEPNQRSIWRATAGPVSGFLIAGTCLVLGIVALSAGLREGKASALESIIPFTIWVVIATFFAQSSVRLVRAGRRAT